MIVKNQRVITENLNNAKCFEHLFSIAGSVDEVDDLVEKNAQVFHQIKIQEDFPCRTTQSRLLLRKEEIKRNI